MASNTGNTASLPNQVTTKDELLELKPHQNKECMFCGRKETSEELYGLLYQINDVVVHYYCILLSSEAAQNGNDEDGLMGFLYKDIKTELTRCSKKKCVYCKSFGANIACCRSKCRKIFHLPCGLRNGSMHQYFNAFKSYCHLHTITQQIDLKYLPKSTPVQCSICKDDVVPTLLPSSLWAPCCKHDAWFHRQCVQQLALSSGYFFKCPLCNNVDIFKNRMLTMGIYIPSRDASWESVPNAFNELLERHNTCNALVCLCPYPEGRNHQQESGRWEIILCYTCGSNGTHMLCSYLKRGKIWFCDLCKNVETSNSTKTTKRRRLEITSTVTSDHISTVPERMSPTNNTLIRRNRRRVTGTRESEMNSNDEVIQTASLISESSSQPLVSQNDTITISDDDSDNSSSPNSSPSPVILRYCAGNFLQTASLISASSTQPLVSQIDTISISDDDSDNSSSPNSSPTPVISRYCAGNFLQTASLISASSTQPLVSQIDTISISDDDSDNSSSPNSSPTPVISRYCAGNFLQTASLISASSTQPLVSQIDTISISDDDSDNSSSPNSSPTPVISRYCAGNFLQTASLISASSTQPLVSQIDTISISDDDSDNSSSPNSSPTPVISRYWSINTIVDLTADDDEDLY